MRGSVLSGVVAGCLFAGTALADGLVDSKVEPIGNAGATIVRYGYEIPRIRCAPLRLCLVALEAGEIVNSVNVGDSKRWMVEPTYTGTKDASTTTILIKPLEEKLETSLVVATDRRSYHMTLEASAHEYMPLVSFSYPSNEETAWRRFIAERKLEASEGEDRKQLERVKRVEKRLISIDAKYLIDGKASWRPEAVYNDGIKTYIQFPKSLEGHELPVLLVLSESGQEMQVNYRMRGRTMKIDHMVHEALLVSGVGDYQERVAISYGED